MTKGTSQCVDCKYAKWSTTAKGRLHPSGDGRCIKQVELPVLPNAYFWWPNPAPVGGQINRRAEFDDSPCLCRKEAGEE